MILDCIIILKVEINFKLDYKNKNRKKKKPV